MSTELALSHPAIPWKSQAERAGRGAVRAELGRLE